MLKKLAISYVNKFKKGILFARTYKKLKKGASYKGNNSKFNFDIYKKIKPRLPGYLIMDVNSSLEMGHKTIISYGAKLTLHRNAHISVGDNTYINFNFICEAAESIKIGKDCAISWNVSIIDSDFHKIEGSKASDPVVVGDHCFIGCNTTILKGVKIGNNCIVGANSVVTKNVPDNCLVCGNPARIIKENISWKD